VKVGCSTGSETQSAQEKMFRLLSGGRKKTSQTEKEIKDVYAKKMGKEGIRKGGGGEKKCKANIGSDQTSDTFSVARARLRNKLGKKTKHKTRTKEGEKKEGRDEVEIQIKVMTTTPKPSKR